MLFSCLMVVFSFKWSFSFNNLLVEDFTTFLLFRHLQVYMFFFFFRVMWFKTISFYLHHLCMPQLWNCCENLNYTFNFVRIFCSLNTIIFFFSSPTKLLICFLHRNVIGDSISSKCFLLIWRHQLENNPQNLFNRNNSFFYTLLLLLFPYHECVGSNPITTAIRSTPFPFPFPLSPVRPPMGAFPLGLNK